MSVPAIGTERPVSFACEGATLVGILHDTPEPAVRGVLVVVGGPQYRVGSHRQFVLLARALASAGIPVLRFDYRGMGDSDGEFRGFEHLDDDIGAAMVAFRRECPALREVVLWGLCDGASAAAFFAGRHPGTVAGLVMANPWVRTEQGLARSYVRNYYGQRLFQASFWRRLLGGEMQVLKALRSFAADVGKARRKAAPGPDAGLPARVRAALEAYRGPLLLLVSGRDLTAGEFLACAGQPDWVSALGRPVFQRVDLPESDHTFSRKAWKAEVAAACVAWLRSW